MHTFQPLSGAQGKFFMFTVAVNVNNFSSSVSSPCQINTFTQYNYFIYLSTSSAFFIPDAALYLAASTSVLGCCVVLRSEAPSSVSSTPTHPPYCKMY